MNGSGFKRAEQQASPGDGYKRLLCTEPGCGRKWSVQIDAPRCSFHQWGQVGDKFPSLASAGTDGDENPDGKRWARRILRLHANGVLIRPYSLKLAQDAVRRVGSEVPAMKAAA